MDLTYLSLTEAARLIRQGEISPVELTEAHLERIAALNPRLNCYLTVDAEGALATARQAESERSRGSHLGPLHGLPLGIKDLFETRGLPNTAGSRFFTDSPSTEDAVVVAKLRQAGAVLLGKLHLHEIALGVTNVNPHYGPCRNPWDPQRITGGSSGGSAAALAAGLCLGALGTDTGGSIRIPASLCGVVGLKPTYGRVSLRGVIPLSWNLDHPGPMARRVAGVALLLSIIAGYDPADPASQPVPVPDYLAELDRGVSGWRIALAADEYFQEVDPAVASAISAAAQVFADLGAQVERVPFPGARQAAQTNVILVTADAAAFHRERLATEPEKFGADIRLRLEQGAAYTSTEYALARRTQAVLRRQFETFFDDWDVLLMPTTPNAAPPIEGQEALEQARRLTRFTAPFNLTGLPALSLPCGFDEQGLPLGMQLVARPWAEDKLLRLAHAYEQATTWHQHRPSL